MRRLLLALVLLGVVIAAPAAAQPSIVGQPFLFGASSSTLSVFALDASGDKAEWVFQAQRAESLTQGCYRHGSRTGTPPTYKISLQSVGTDGNPTGTILGGGTPASVTFTPPADDTWLNTGRCLTFANPYTTARGEVYALVVEYDSGTIDGSNFFNITSRQGLHVAAIAFPYAITNAAGVRTRHSAAPVAWVKSATTTYGNPFVAIQETAYSSNSTPDEYAVAFSAPAGPGVSYSVLGVRTYVVTAAAAKTILVTLYTGTTPLQTVTMDSDHVVSAGANRVYEVMFDEVTLTVLDSATTYRIGFAPQETVANLALSTAVVQTAGERSAWGGGTNYYLSTRTDAGAWTDETTKRPIVELLLVDLAADGAEAAGETSHVFVQ